MGLDPSIRVEGGPLEKRNRARAMPITSSIEKGFPNWTSGATHR
jgi:hypothetical protein